MVVAVSTVWHFYSGQTGSKFCSLTPLFAYQPTRSSGARGIASSPCVHSAPRAHALVQLLGSEQNMAKTQPGVKQDQRQKMVSPMQSIEYSREYRHH